MPIPSGDSGDTLDMLITRAELATWLQVPDVDNASADLVIQAATAKVQAASKQRLIYVAGDVATLPGTWEPWTLLPQRPVVSVASVTLDGTVLALGTGSTDYAMRGSRLYRDAGWQDTATALPSQVAVVYDHGWVTGDQALELARDYCKRLSGLAYVNPNGARMLSIDDYQESWSAESASNISLSRDERNELRRAYGQFAGTVALT